MTIAWIAAASGMNDGNWPFLWNWRGGQFGGMSNDESIWIKLLNFGPDHGLQSELKLNVNCKMKFKLASG